MRAAIFALALSTILVAADSRTVDKTVSLSPTGSVAIENHKGSINVATWDRAEVEVHARIEMEDGEFASRRQFESAEVLIEGSGNSMSIRTRYPETWSEGSNPAVYYTVRMPRTASLSIRDHRSNIEVSELKGALSLNTHRGTARVHKLSGPLTLSTHRGDIHVDFTTFTADSSVESHRGTIELSLPKNSKFDLRSRTERHGSFESDFPLTARGTSRRGQEVRASMNGGGPVLEMKTDRAEIRLRAI